MKYGQLMFGLLAGCALGAFVMTGNYASAGAGVKDRAAVEQIVRDVIAKEPKLILDSVQKYQEELRNGAMKEASAALKDKDLRDKIFNDENTAFVGPKDAKKVVVEYFDYNCPACKMMYRTVDQLVQKNKDVKIIFKEFPIFGPTSDSNTKMGLAVWHYYPEKYYDFYAKMLSLPGHGDGDKQTLKFIGDMGMDVKKIKAYAASPEADAILKANREQGEKLGIQGTPTVIIGDEVIGHALAYPEVISKLGAGDDAKPSEVQKPADTEAPVKHDDKPARDAEE